MPSRSEPTDPLRQALRALATSFSEHPSPEALAAYREAAGGADTSDEIEAIREHVASCAACTTELLLLDALLAPAAARPEEEIPAAELTAAWEVQRAFGIAPSARPPVRIHRSRRSRLPTGTALLAVAASILAGVTLVQWRRIVELERPRVNSPLLHLVPLDSMRQGAAKTPVLHLADEGGRALLILNPEADLEGLSSFDIEVIGPDDAVELRFAGVPSSDEGSFRLEIPGDALPSGRHRIVLYGHREGGRQAMGRFEFDVSGPVE